jgi:hypothetical protein
MHLNADESWNVGSSIDLFSVALHEAGHALGLAHTDDPTAVMYPYYKFHAGLLANDIGGVQALYGAQQIAATNLSVQRQLGSNTVASVSYVGTMGHKLLSDLESNPGNPALCLSTPVRKYDDVS